MKCPNCKDVDLKEVLTTKGVMVDTRPKCEGIWLDKGEIFYFTKAPTYLRYKIEEALKNQRPSERLNPKTKTPLVELPLFEGDLIIDYCPKTKGIWLDKGEIEKLPGAKKFKLKLAVESNFKASQEYSLRLPNLGLVSSATLVGLYALLTIILITLVNFGFISAFGALLFGIIFALLQFIFSPFIMDLILRWFYHLHWAELEELPAYLADFIREVSTKKNIKTPRMGIIPDGSPNAFTYGHTPNNARIVITNGIMDLLEPEEVKAVVAHEFGHVVHWDMLVMTIANLVPLILYYIYRTLIRVRSRGREDKSAAARYAIALASYILYIISQYIVLWFSRVREYFADRFSGETTNNPNSLASALVKIGYGLAGKEKNKKERDARTDSLKAMGVFDPSAAKALAVTTYHPASMGGEVDKSLLKGAMRWDLWNPWALYYELHSTHPLIAKRLLALSRQSQAYGKEPYITFDERRPESYWDEFFVDLFISALPIITMFAIGIVYFLTTNIFYLKAGSSLIGAAYLAVVYFSYNFSYFPEMNIASLLKKVKVSKIRPVPCVVKGKIVGRGIPGLIFSEDFVLQDGTGIIFLDYQQPLGIWNFFFGLLRAKRYIGEEVTITGWYRRSPVPYIEIKTLETEYGKSNCYVFNVKIIFAWVLIVGGIVAMFLL